jgi:hypothetical protein
MGQATDGQLPADTLGYRAEGIYVPNIGTVAQQGAVVGTDAAGTNYAAQVVTTSGGSLTALSPANTGLPVNVPVIVQRAHAVSAASGTTLGALFTSANAAGNSIIVVVGAGSNGTLSIADTASNTYLSAVSGANSTTFEAQIFYATNIVSNAANTVTVTTTSSSSLAIQVYEVSGLIAQAGALGQNSSGSGTGATASTSNLSAGSPNSLIFLGVGVGTTAEAITAVSGTNWTVDSSQNPTSPSGLFSFGSLSLALDNTGPVIPQATIAASKPYAAVSAIFKPVVLGIQGTVTIGGYNYTHLAGTGTTLVKTGPGILHAIVINTPVAGTLEADDALTNTTPVIGILTVGTATAMPPFSVPYDVAFTTGLTIKITTGAMDATIVWK